jgi:ABC-type bacteriocin/lantibiotic exporter with double-glycine peptidase domain
MVAYCAHETLIEEGSTGQRQLVNINQVLTTKTNSQIFLFDEADSGLDKERQEEFYQKLTNSAKEKLMIYVKA